MQLGIVGFPKVGKTLLFNILTGTQQETGKFSSSQKVHAAAARVDDERLAQLRDLYSPKKYTPATVDYVDLPGLVRGDNATGPDLAVLKPVDALVHVVRCFEDPEILHAAGSVDPARDIHELDLELVLADHELVSRRLEKLKQAAKRGMNDDEKREQAAARGHRAALARGGEAAAPPDPRRRRRPPAARLPTAVGEAAPDRAQRRRGSGHGAAAERDSGRRGTRRPS